jgi:Cys-rich repeat protein
MNKLVKSVSLLVAAGFLSTLAGCDLYFGDHNNSGDSWTYCGSDGFYSCSGDNCEWVSSTCPDGSGSSMGSGGSNGGSGAECSSDAQCAAGCYCDSAGTCEEGGFCTTNADCGPGYSCNTQRSSCEPNPPGCTADSDCTSGQVCDTSNGSCTAGTCAVDTTITCATAAPTCPSGQVPNEFNGCYTGACTTAASCTTPASCQYLNDEDDCLARQADCSASYTGLNCTNGAGTSCHSGESGCTCTDFEFAKCVDRTAN